MTKRYEHLLQAIREKQPTAIMEIGVWNGMRALSMLNLAPKAKYYGFDLFEDATAQTDKEELNSKPHNAMQTVWDRLTGFDVALVKGNTRETLPLFNEPVDFVFIDGGHSVETIRSDWENVKRVIVPGARVFFDDYLTATPIDYSSLWGCNAVVKDLRHEVLPSKDWLKGGGHTQIVMVWP